MEELKGLPASLREIGEVTENYQLPWKLMEYFGGLKVYIPYKPTEDFLEALGESSTQLLCKHFGGVFVDIPNGASLRSFKIAILKAEGTTREIAKKLGCTERWVRAVRNHSIDVNQISLFDKK